MTDRTTEILNDMAHTLRRSGEMHSVRVRKPKTDPHLEATGRLGERIIIRAEIYEHRKEA